MKNLFDFFTLKGFFILNLKKNVKKDFFLNKLEI